MGQDSVANAPGIHLSGPESTSLGLQSALRGFQDEIATIANMLGLALIQGGREASTSAPADHPAEAVEIIRAFNDTGRLGTNIGADALVRAFVSACAIRRRELTLYIYERFYRAAGNLNYCIDAFQADIRDLIHREVMAANNARP